MLLVTACFCPFGRSGVEPTSELDESTTSAELALMVDESHDQGLIDSQEYALIESAIAFGQMPATSVMAQIDHVHSVSVDSEIVEIEETSETAE